MLHVATIIVIVGVVLCACEGIPVHLVFGTTVSGLIPRSEHMTANLSDALYQVSCLERYSILNHSYRYLPSPPPVPVVEVGMITLDATDGVVSAVLTGYSMMSFEVSSNQTADLLMFLANVDIGGGAFANILSPVRALGVVGGQWFRPAPVGLDGTLSVTLTVGLAVVVFTVFLFASVVSSRRRMIQESRGINFNDLIRLEIELYEDADRRLMLL
jgi:hypothetical protein